MNASARHERFAARVASAAGRLSPQEKAVAEFFIERPQDVVTASAAEIAAITGTSDATVVRAARSLGYSGLRELKRALLADVTTPRDPAVMLEQRLERVTTRVGPVLDQVLTDASALLDQVRGVLDEAAWRHVVDLLDGAAAVWLYGIGPAGLTAEYHALELSRLGRRARAITQTGVALADPLMAMAAGDVVVIYAPLRRFHEIDVVIRRARQVEAGVVVISQTLGPGLHDRVDAVLTTPPTTTTTASEHFATLLLAHALTLELATRDRVRSVTARHLLTDLRADLTAPAQEPPNTPHDPT